MLAVLLIMLVTVTVARGVEVIKKGIIAASRPRYNIGLPG